MKRMWNRFGVLAVAATVLGTGPIASAQKFSAPEKPAEPTKQPDAPEGEAPATPPSDVNTVPGGGGKWVLPLKLYDEKANAAQDIQNARQEAMKENKRVLVMWGENKCEFCAYLNELLTTDPQIRQLVESEYVWIKVDIGKFDKNIELANHYDTPMLEQGFGAPALTIIDPKTDKAITRAGGNAMVHKPMMPPNLVFDPPFIMNMLSGGRATPQVATMLMLEAQQKAKSQDKLVLAYFHIWASESCKAWDKFVKDPEAAKVLEKAFVPRKIDTERDIAGTSLLQRLKGSKAVSPPWATVLTPDGTAAPSAGTGLNFDSTNPDAALLWLMEASGGKFSEEDRATLSRTLAAACAPPAKDDK